MGASYNKTTKNNRHLSRKLSMKCSVHGDLIGFSDEINIVIYESFNYEHKKVELKCFLCLKEEYNRQKSKNDEEIKK
ncbi:hypothetical protein F4694_004697 [Bacillus niacini]|uniref:Uncharacterized protein n=1 Tax=Neobacillus niacini TaxID=86668 RepID=A0A852TJH1_9BACI|nr:hypothetical protein [Neobacillus niacini]